jgi:methyl-accepting chemotaxis protein
MMDRVAAERAEALRETRGDLLAFVGAFGAGLLLYVVLHVWLEVRQAYVTFAILGVMAAYAVLAMKTARFRVRLDQAGDNAYYLGLLFTLTSMAFALYQFGLATELEGSGVEQIISNFGIALASTVAGIFLRVFLHQMRVDPADVENMTRIELSDASKRVRASLDTVYLDFGRFHSEVRQRTEDIVNKLVNDTATNQREILTRTAEMSELLVSGAAAAKAAIEKLHDVAPPPAELAVQLRELSAAVGKLTADLDAVARSVRATTEEAALAQNAATEVLSRLTSMTRALTAEVRGAGAGLGDADISRPS